MEWARQWLVVGLLGVVGIGLVGYGFWEQFKPREVAVEIIKEGVVDSNILISDKQNEIVVDVAGAVEKPGVYKLSSGSRIGDALVMAGGLAATADREWVARTLNLAQKLTDGEKIFIPMRDENNIQAPNTKNETMKSENSNTKTINVNTASVSELDRLEGIGEARALAIVANRPYGKIEELVSKAKIPESVYEKIRDNISVY